MHPLIEAAGIRGELPDWAQISDARRAHTERVSELLEEWAAALGCSDEEQVRWRAAGRLHDALKDAPTHELEALVGADGWPEPLLHAPAVSERLSREGVDDTDFLRALRYHSIGHPDFEALGEHLYLADYLERGRPDTDERVSLREAMPGGCADVLPVVIRRRMERLLANGDQLLAPAVGFWNRTVGSPRVRA